MKIIKRNGKIVDFDKNKIYNAMFKAWKEIYPREDEEPEYFNKIMEMISEAVEEAYIETHEYPTVEDIQDMVEDLLTSYDVVVGKTYVKYRYKRGVMRSCSDEFIRSISEKLNASNVKNQNANVDEHSFGGRVGEASDEMMKQYALDFCMSEMAKNNHLNNEIYIHKLNCA